MRNLRIMLRAEMRMRIASTNCIAPVDVITGGATESGADASRTERRWVADTVE